MSLPTNAARRVAATERMIELSIECARIAGVYLQSKRDLQNGHRFYAIAEHLSLALKDSANDTRNHVVVEHFEAMLAAADYAIADFNGASGEQLAAMKVDAEAKMILFREVNES